MEEIHLPLVHMSKSSSSSDNSRSSTSGAGNISFGAASSGVMKRENVGIPSLTGCANETRLKIACFLRSPRGEGSADGDDGGKTAPLSIMESVPKRREGDGSTGGGAGNAAGSGDVETGSMQFNSFESMDLRRRCKIALVPGPANARG
jgi:hypothetical protein